MPQEPQKKANAVGSIDDSFLNDTGAVSSNPPQDDAAGKAPATAPAAGYMPTYTIPMPLGGAIPVRSDVPGKLGQAALETGKDVAAASAPVIAHRVLQRFPSINAHMPSWLGGPGGDMYKGETTMKGLPPAMVSTFLAAGGASEPVPEARPVYPGANQPTVEGFQARGLAMPPVSTDVASTTGTPEALGKIPVPKDPYAGVDFLRSKLTATPPETVDVLHKSQGLAGVQALNGPMDQQASALATVGNAGERSAMNNFINSNPSALGRIQPVTAPGEAGSMVESVKALPDIAKMTKDAISEGRAAKIPTRVRPVSAKTEGPTVAEKQAELERSSGEKSPSSPERVSGGKPETPKKPGPSASERRTSYLFGEHADKFDPENKGHLQIERMTHEQLAQEANKRSLKGRTNWSKDDFGRSTASHGKSSNPNASFVRGKLLEEK